MQAPYYKQGLQFTTLCDIEFSPGKILRAGSTVTQFYHRRANDNNLYVYAYGYEADININHAYLFITRDNLELVETQQLQKNITRPFKP